MLLCAYSVGLKGSPIVTGGSLTVMEIFNQLDKQVEFKINPFLVLINLDKIRILNFPFSQFHTNKHFEGIRNYIMVPATLVTTAKQRYLQ